MSLETAAVWDLYPWWLARWKDATGTGRCVPQGLSHRRWEAGDPVGQGSEKLRNWVVLGAGEEASLL